MKEHAEKAAQESLKADELLGTDPKTMAQLKEAFAKSGAQGYWRRTLENYKETAKSNYVAPVLVAEACARIGGLRVCLRMVGKRF